MDWPTSSGRTLSTIPVILVVALVVFAILRLAPGDPAAILAGTGGAEVDPAIVEKIRKQLGLDQPLHVQLYRYFSDLARGDLGQSLLSKHNVSDLIRARVVPTISLTIMTELFALVMAVPLGVLAAWKADSWIDRICDGHCHSWILDACLLARFLDDLLLCCPIGLLSRCRLQPTF